MSGSPDPPPVPPIPSDLLFLTPTVVDPLRSPSPVAPGGGAPPPFSPVHNSQGRAAVLPVSSPYPPLSPSPPSQVKKTCGEAPPASPNPGAVPADPMVDNTKASGLDSGPANREPASSSPVISENDFAAAVAAVVADYKGRTAVKPFVPSLGAWKKPLKLAPEVKHPSPPQFASPVTDSQPEKGIPTPALKEDGQLRFPWAAKMDPNLRNLHRATSPTYLEDGTPMVDIPNHVLLQGLENQKEYVLGQFSHCKTPSGGLVHAVANRIWGKNCKIFTPKLGDSSYLFHIPNASTRAWVLQRGFWHVDDCLLFVAPWTPEATLATPEISTLPIWVTLKNIPSRLYSHMGFSWVASGLGEPVLTQKPRLDPTLMGEAKLLVEVELDKGFPSRIAARDKKGFVSWVDVEYAWIPSKCVRCGHLGHKLSRCLLQHQDVVISRDDATSVDVAPTVDAAVTSSETVVPNTVVPVAHVNSPATEPLLNDSLDLASATVPNIIESSSPSSEAATFVKAAHTSNSPSVKTYGSTSTTTAMGDQADASNQSSNAPIAATTHFSFGQSSDQVFLAPLQDVDQVTTSFQRTLRERPVKHTQKVQDMMEWSIATGRGKRGKRGKRGRG